MLYDQTFFPEVTERTIFSFLLKPNNIFFTKKPSNPGIKMVRP